LIEADIYFINRSFILVKIAVRVNFHCSRSKNGLSVITAFLLAKRMQLIDEER
jgi:hypothetical protein